MKNTQSNLLNNIIILYITFQLISDVTASKLIDIGGVAVSASVIYFPITYIFADIITEVYGLKVARRAAFQVLICSVIAGLLYQFIVALPITFGDNQHYQVVLGSVPRVLIGGWLAVWSGSMVNNIVLDKLKNLTKSKYLWLRTISSTIIGEFVNTLIFYIVALSASISNDVLIKAIIAAWIFKVLVEVLFTPLTFIIINYLKVREGLISQNKA